MLSRLLSRRASCVASAVRARPHVGARRPRANTVEDAHFVCAMQPGRLLLGVADGVGSWHAYGVDPALYAVRLMADCAAAAAAEAGAGELLRAPAEVLHAAWLSTQAATIVGSCTAAVVAIGNDGAVAAAGVGDVSVLVLEHTGGAWRVSARLQHVMRGFNFPAALGFAPGAHADAFAAPASAALLHVPAEAGVPRLVLVASDGLLDNLFEEELLTHVEAAVKADRAVAAEGAAAAAAAAAGAGATAVVADSSGVPPCGWLQALAARLADAALARSLEHRNGPFALAAAEHDIVWKAGGRPDDISVLLCRAGAARSACVRCE